MAAAVSHGWASGASTGGSAGNDPRRLQPDRVGSAAPEEEIIFSDIRFSNMNVLLMLLSVEFLVNLVLAVGFLIRQPVAFTQLPP